MGQAIYIGEWNSYTEAQKATLYALGYKWISDRYQVVRDYPPPAGTFEAQYYREMPPPALYKAGETEAANQAAIAAQLAAEAAYDRYALVQPPTLLPSCVWQCEQPLNGYEKDGCGNRRLNTACNPPTSSLLQLCQEGTTRAVKCPKDPNKIVTQRCVNGAWVTLPADEKACEKTDPARIIIAAVIIAIVLIFLTRRK